MKERGLGLAREPVGHAASGSGMNALLIGKELGDVESQLAGFKQQNGLIDLKETARSVLTETTTARQASLTAETQLNVAKYLNDYLADHSNDRDLIPLFARHRHSKSAVRMLYELGFLVPTTVKAG